MALRRSAARHRLSLIILLTAAAFGTPVVALSGAAPGGGTDIFSASCRTSHIAPDDPIVHPGRPGASHLHVFSGAWSTNAFTTPESLVASGTTCDPHEDTGAYWTPMLYVKGKPVEITHTTAYYAPGRKRGETQRAGIKAWPQGFRVIADVKSSTFERTGYDHAGWLCSSGLVKNGYEASLTDITYHCPSGLQARIIFPDCWDGVNLDTVSPDGTAAFNPVTKQPYPNDHRSHATYAPEGGQCPATHPVATPRLDLKISFKTKGLVDSNEHRPASAQSDGGDFDEPGPMEGDTPADFTLAGGGVNGAPIANTYDVDTFHADFYNGWKQDQLEALIGYCIRDKQAVSNTRPCLNPNSHAVANAAANPNFPNATPGGPGTSGALGAPDTPGTGTSGLPPAPDTTITSGPVSPTLDSAVSTFVFRSDVEDATFACKLDDEPFTDCRSPQSYTGLPAGGHSFSVQARADGVSDASAATQTWTIASSGTSKPVVGITSPTPGQTVSGKLTITGRASDPPATINGTNIREVQFLLDDELIATDTESSYRHTLDTTRIGNGQHTITIRVYDMASPSNVSSTSVTFTVDNPDSEKPTSPSSVRGVVVTPTTASLTWSPSIDEASGIARYIVLRDQTVVGQPTDNTFTDSGLTPDTQYKYRVRAVDGAGNVSTTSAARIVTTTLVGAVTTAPGALVARSASLGAPGAASAQRSGSNGSALPGAEGPRSLPPRPHARAGAARSRSACCRSDRSTRTSSATTDRARERYSGGQIAYWRASSQLAIRSTTCSTPADGRNVRVPVPRISSQAL